MRVEKSNLPALCKKKLEALREHRPPWPRQIITPILPTVKMLSLGCERLPTHLRKKKKKKKKKFWIITFTTIWVCYHYYGVFLLIYSSYRPVARLFCGGSQIGQIWGPFMIARGLSCDHVEFGYFGVGGGGVGVSDDPPDPPPPGYGPVLQYPDHHQNLISSSLYYSGPIHKISS